MLFTHLFSPAATILFASVSLALPASGPDASKPTVQVKQIFGLDKPSWLENIAVRSNGEILVSRLDKAELYLVDPSSGKNSLIASFPGVTSAWGIAEYAPDVFAVAVGNFSIGSSFASIPHTYSVQSIDLSKGLNADGRATPRLLSNVSDASNLNGLTFRAPHTLYASDAFAFKIWEIDTRTGAYRTAVPTQPLLAGGTHIPLGVNGIRWSAAERALFFANSDQALLGVLAARPDGSFAPARQIATNPAPGSSYDDFTLDGEDDFYAATNTGNTLNFVSRDGSMQFVVAGDRNSTQLAGPTSAQFGRTPADRKTLYVTTSGGLAAPINGTVVVGAQLLAVNFDY